MSHAPVAEMNESDFNKHWNVLSNVSIINHYAISTFKVVIHLWILIMYTDTFWWNKQAIEITGNILFSSLDSTIVCHTT